MNISAVQNLFKSHSKLVVTAFVNFWLASFSEQGKIIKISTSQQIFVFNLYIEYKTTLFRDNLMKKMVGSTVKSTEGSHVKTLKSVQDI